MSEAMTERMLGCMEAAVRRRGGGLYRVRAGWSDGVDVFPDQTVQALARRGFIRIHNVGTLATITRAGHAVMSGEAPPSARPRIRAALGGGKH